MNDCLFTGAATALVTPFLNGAVNYPLFEQLLRRQVDAGIEAVVVAGTTGNPLHSPMKKNWNYSPAPKIMWEIHVRSLQEPALTPQYIPLILVWRRKNAVWMDFWL